MPVGHLYVSSGKMSIQVFCPLFNWIVSFLSLFLFLLRYSYMSSLHIGLAKWPTQHFRYQSLIRYMICSYFLPFSKFAFHFVDGFLCYTESFQYDVVPLIFMFVAFAFGIRFKNLSPTCVNKLTTYVFLQEFCGFRSSVQVFNPVLVNFCVWCQVLFEFPMHVAVLFPNTIYFILFINLFIIYFWLHWVFVAARGSLQLRRVGATLRCGARALGAWASVPVARGLQSAGSVVVTHGPSCSAARGILPDQGSNVCPLHWQADS